MPNFFSPFLPTFGIHEDSKKAIKKAETYLLGYAAGISIARKIPSTAKPIGFLLGLNIVPGKGITVKPVAIPLIYAPQPLGVMPPKYYSLPNSIGDPLVMGKLLLGKNPREAIAKQFNDDLTQQEIENEVARRQNVAALSPYEREVFAALAAGRVPRQPTVFDLTTLKQNEDGSFRIGLPVVAPFDRASLDEVTGGVFGDQSGVLGAVPPPNRDGSGIAFNPPGGGDRGGDPEQDQLNALSELNRLNPPDP